MSHMFEGASTPSGQEVSVYAQLRRATERSLLNRLLPVRALQCDEETMIRHLAERIPKGMSWETLDVDWTVVPVVDIHRVNVAEPTQISAWAHYRNLRPVPLVDGEPSRTWSDADADQFLQALVDLLNAEHMLQAFEAFVL
jgi:hypothetical protein